MQEYENKDLGISGALAQTAKVATIDKVADEVISSTWPLAGSWQQKLLHMSSPSIYIVDSTMAFLCIFGAFSNMQRTFLAYSTAYSHNRQKIGVGPYMEIFKG